MNIGDRGWRNHWQPHGIIVTEVLEVLYREASLTSGNGNPTQEWKPVELAEDLPRKVIFPEDKFDVNSQYPLVDKKGPLEKGDEVVQTTDVKDIKLLFYLHEVKRPQHITPTLIFELEGQLLRYCKLFLEDSKPGMFIVAARPVCIYDFTLTVTENQISDLSGPEQREILIHIAMLEIQ
ncbi:hypothetical protein V8C37DRAFT_415273 [Trichoderma ceciliae]